MPYGKQRFKSGIRPWTSLPAKFRSGWEYNCCLWLDSLKIKWEYEPTRFKFTKIKSGTISYTPDVYIPKYKPTKHNGLPELNRSSIYIEIKGWISAQDKTRIRRFKRYYPEEFALLVGIPGSPKSEAAKFFNEMNIPILCYYNDLHKLYKDTMPHWGE